MLRSRRAQAKGDPCCKVSPKHPSGIRKLPEPVQKIKSTSTGNALRRLWSATLWWFWAFIGVGICALVVAILQAGRSHTIELVSHFAFHGLVVGAITLGMLSLYRRTWLTWVVGAAVVYLLVLVQPWDLYLPRARQTAGLNHSIRVLSWNVLATNDRYEDIDRVIRTMDADVVVLIETQPNMLDKLPALDELYPLSAEHLKWGGSGICIFSKVPGTTFQLADFECPRQPALIATIGRQDSADSSTANTPDSELVGPIVKLIGMHTMSPLPTSRTVLRDRQLHAFVEWARSEPGPVCLTGDLNTTPWTHAFQELVRGGFVDSRLGTGNCPSWPSELGWLAIPIDHALTKGNCTITDRRVLSDAPGSDHRPIVFTLNY